MPQAAAAQASTAPPPAQAAPTGIRIVLVTNHADATIMPLLKAELERLGLDVRTMDKGEEEVIPRDLGRAARKKDAIAGIRVVVAERTVEVWVADRVTGKVTLREILKQQSLSKADESTVVLQAVELLRVSLMELDAPHQARGEIEPPPELEALKGFPESRGVLGAYVGGGAMFTSADYALSPTLVAGARLRAHRFVTVGLRASIGLTSATISEPEGQGDISPRLFSAHISVTPAESTDFVQPSIGIGGGLLWLTMDGTAIVPRQSLSYDATSAVLHGEADLTLRFTHNFRAFARVEAGATLRTADILFEDRVVAQTSRLLLQPTAGLELAVP